MGIHSKNREEWVTVSLAAMRQGVTIVPFFDSLGKDALSFVINQTELQTMCIEGKHFQNLIDLKTSGKIPTLKNVVLLDPVTE